MGPGVCPIGARRATCLSQQATAELPKMFVEHKTVLKALVHPIPAAQEKGRSGSERWAERLVPYVHPEEVLYSAVMMTGNDLRKTPDVVAE